MRSRILPLLALLTTSPLPAQWDPVQELERTCTRTTDDPSQENLKALQHAIDRETGPRSSFLAGCRLLAQQEWGPAGREFEKAVKAAPDEPVYHFWFGRATGEQTARARFFRQPGLARRTKGEFERAIALDPTYVAPREGLLRYYLVVPGFAGGGVDKARAEADAIARINPYRGGLAHATVAFSAKDTSAALQAHETLIGAFPDSATSYFAVLDVQLARMQWALAWAIVDQLEQRRPDLAAVRYAIGRVAAESGEQLDRGEAALRAYIRHAPLPDEPALADAHWRLGVIAERRGKTVAARQSYQVAMEMDPKLRAAREALARLK